MASCTPSMRNLSPTNRKGGASRELGRSSRRVGTWLAKNSLLLRGHCTVGSIDSAVRQQARRTALSPTTTADADEPLALPAPTNSAEDTPTKPAPKRWRRLATEKE